jgi:hypothetical protein
MGHMSISSHLSASSCNVQNEMVPNQTEVSSLQSMQPKNPQQPGGKKKRNKNKIFNTEQGTAPTQKNQGGA